MKIHEYQAKRLLADAGVPMRSLVTSVACGKIDNEIVVDLSGVEDKAGDADLPCAITWFNEELSLLQFDGVMTADEFDTCLDLAKEALTEIYDLQLKALKRKYIEIQEEFSTNKKVEEGGES